MKAGELELGAPLADALREFSVVSRRAPFLIGVALLVCGVGLLVQCNRGVVCENKGVSSMFLAVAMIGPFLMLLAVLPADKALLLWVYRAFAFLLYPAVSLLFFAFAVMTTMDCGPPSGAGCVFLVGERVASWAVFGYGSLVLHRALGRRANGLQVRSPGGTLAKLWEVSRWCIFGKIAATLVFYPLAFAVEPAFLAAFLQPGFWIITDADLCNADPTDAEPTPVVLFSLFVCALLATPERRHVAQGMLLYGGGDTTMSSRLREV